MKCLQTLQFSTGRGGGDYWSGVSVCGVQQGVKCLHSMTKYLLRVLLLGGGNNEASLRS